MRFCRIIPVLLTAAFAVPAQGCCLAFAELLELQRTIPERAIRATANARVTLMDGFTTVRNLGSGTSWTGWAFGPGLAADIVAVPGNPVSDIKALRTFFS